jgi:hypothetical protein
MPALKKEGPNKSKPRAEPPVEAKPPAKQKTNHAKKPSKDKVPHHLPTETSESEQ